MRSSTNQYRTSKIVSIKTAESAVQQKSLSSQIGTYKASKSKHSLKKYRKKVA